MPSLLPKSQLSKVNARHLLQDLAESYTYPLSEAVLVEMIANSLDAHSAEISIEQKTQNRTFAIEDNGKGMTKEEFERYHNLAESRKERGRGIGFAGLGAKLAHKVSHKVLTETCSDGHRAASDWHFKGDDLEWRATRLKELRHDGTKVTLSLPREGHELLNPQFVQRAMERHYGALLEPYLSETYVWESIYPEGITFRLNGEVVSQRPWIPHELVEQKKEFDILAKNRKRIARAVFIFTKRPVKEDKRGITIATLGKTIKRDFWGVHPRSPERVSGCVEAPGLVECLTLNKQDFMDHGPAAEKVRRIRREVQKALGEWLAEIGQRLDQEDRHRAPKALERETAQVVWRIPELRNLFSGRLHEMASIPNPDGDLRAKLGDSMQFTGGLGVGGGGGDGGGDGVPISPGAEEGEALTPADDGGTKATARRRRLRAGPTISSVSEPSRDEISWLDGEEVVINTGHVAYKKAQREHQLLYHQRIAVYYAICQEASAGTEEKFSLLNRALTEWGKS